MMRTLYSLAVVSACFAAAPAWAQTATTKRSAETAYGARMTELAETVVNERRVNNRVNNRIGNRLSTRIERYAVLTDPAALLATTSAQQAPQASGRTLPPIPVATPTPTTTSSDKVDER